MHVTFSGRRLDDQDLPVPCGAYAGLARLLEGISGIAARGRVVPREGRFILLADQRRLVVSVVALPGLEGDSLTLDLREERIATRSRGQIEAEIPDLPRAVDHLAESGRGLLIVTGSDEADTSTGVATVLDLLGQRCPRRVGVGVAGSLHPVEAPSQTRDEEEIPFEAFLDRAIVDAPDVVVLRGLERAGRAAAIRDQAARRVVIATFVPALDACAAVESLGRAGTGSLVREPLVGILAVRLMESLCTSCRRPVDPFEFLPQAARHRRPPAGLPLLPRLGTSAVASGVRIPFLPAAGGSVAAPWSRSGAAGRPRLAGAEHAVPGGARQGRLRDRGRQGAAPSSVS